MDMTSLIYALAALASGGAALLAWAAKLRWSQEYKSATDQVIKAKEAEISALKTEIGALQSVSSNKLLEHAASTRKGLEELIDTRKQELEVATIKIQDLTIEIAGLKSQLKPLGSAENEGRLLTAASHRHITERAESLEGELQVAVKEERLAKLKLLTTRLIQLERAPELVAKSMAEIGVLHAERARIQVILEQQNSAWLRDREAAASNLTLINDALSDLFVERKRLSQCLPAETENDSLKEVEELLSSFIRDEIRWRTRSFHLQDKPDEISVLEQQLRTIEGRLSDAVTQQSRSQAAAQELESIRSEVEIIRAEYEIPG